MASSSGINLLLDSQLAQLQRDGANQKSHDFTVNFSSPIDLDRRKNYKIALDELITMSYSWYNIASAFDNNKLKWRKINAQGAGDWNTLIFPDGMFNYQGINSYIQAETGYIDPDAEEKKTHLRAVLRLYPLPGCAYDG